MWDETEREKSFFLLGVCFSPPYKKKRIIFDEGNNPFARD
jgi:hypothetical protein